MSIRIRTEIELLDKLNKEIEIKNIDNNMLRVLSLSKNNISEFKETLKSNNNNEEIINYFNNLLNDLKNDYDFFRNIAYKNCLNLVGVYEIEEALDKNVVENALKENKYLSYIKRVILKMNSDMNNYFNNLVKYEDLFKEDNDFDLKFDRALNCLNRIIDKLLKVIKSNEEKIYLIQKHKENFEYIMENVKLEDLDNNIVSQIEELLFYEDKYKKALNNFNYNLHSLKKDLLKEILKIKNIKDSCLDIYRIIQIYKEFTFNNISEYKESLETFVRYKSKILNS